LADLSAAAKGLRTVNIAILLDLVADAFGDRTAITDGGESLSFEELRGIARRVGADLLAGDAATLAFADSCSAAVPSALFGAAWAGASYAPLNFRLPPESLGQQIRRLERPSTVASDKLCAELEGLEEGLGGGSLTTTTEWMKRSGQGVDDGSGYVEEPEQSAVILFTSGSSGTPKAALLSHDNLASYVMDTVEFASADEDEALLLAAPPFHIAGVAAVLTSVYSGRRILPLPAFSAEGWLELARTGGATHAFVVPTMLARIVQLMDTDPALRVPTLRSLSYGGARMALPILERALELFPETNFVNAYGLTETSSTIAVLGPDDHRDAFAGEDPGARRRLESVGRPLPGIEVAIFDDSGTMLDQGSRGLIRVRGAQVSGEYLDTASNLDEAGWLQTGDVGSIDELGYLYVEGRADDVIIKGGENLSPSEIEDAMLRHAGVQAVAVVGVPDPEWGESVAAAVVLSSSMEGTHPDEVADVLCAWVRERLGSLKTPSRMVIYEELPTTASGKVLRRVVRDELAADQADAPGSAVSDESKGVR
jgi:acyl-CoA synthetase (AMP-forming)/AMP-acid ligase II